MFKKLLLVLALSTCASIAFAQTCPTRPTSDSSNSCASTAFTHNVVNASGGITQLTGDVTAGPGSGSQAATFTTAQPNAHTWAAIQTFTVAPVFTLQGASRAALGLGTSPADILNCSLAASVSGNALTIALKDQSGSDPSATSPCTVSFRSATATTGTYSSVLVTGALSFATGTSGSTFGSSSSNIPFRLWITAWNNAGTLVLGVSSQSNASTVFPINEGAVQSSTACNACTNAATAGVFYTTAAQTSKAIRILGYMDWATGLATAGTWATGPTTIQMFGPGVKKPGDIVQNIISTTSTPTRVTSATKTATNSQVVIAPTAAMNPIRVRAFGTIEGEGTGAVASSYAMLGRNSNSNLIGTQAWAGQGTGTAVWSGAVVYAFDRPGVITNTTYTVYIWTDNIAADWIIAAPGGNTVSPAPQAIIEAEEIMG